MSINGAELLVRLDTSPLESRLSSLTDQWEGQVRGLRNAVETCTADVRAVSADVAAVQRFLLSYHRREMTQAVSAEEDDDSTDDRPADPLKQCAMPSVDATSTENLLKMVTIARRLLADNAALRSSLDSATATLATYNVTHDSLLQEVVQLRELTAQQSERLQNMSDWLGMSGLPMNAGAAESGEVSGAPACATSDASSPSAEAFTQSTEAVLARSPLLLSFRRFLLRDLTERLTSVVDQQSKDFHDTVAHLESRIQSGQCVVMGGAPQQGGGDSSGDLLETVRTLTKRVKDVEQRAVKREEFTSLMRSKADSLLLPVKADSAAVTEMERRLTTRCADLEERCAYADAERAEFRAILRSLIAAQSAAAAAAPRPSGCTTPDSATTSAATTPAATAPQQGTVLRDVLPALPAASAATAASSTTTAPLSRVQSRHSPRGAPSTTSATSSPPPPSPLPPQQLYRVVGSLLGVGVHGVPSSSAATAVVNSGGAPLREATMTATTSSGTRRDLVRPQSTPAKGSEESVVVIGMTASQGDYANYVTEQLTRKQIASLPALPYERMPKAQ